MREIKFRAWDKKNKKMHYDVQLEDDFWAILYPQGEYVDWEIAGQYTGVRDSENKEVYEGDILDVDWGDGRRLGVVIFCYGKFALKTVDGELIDFQDLLENQAHILILGNVYEEPQLLEDK